MGDVSATQQNFEPVLSEGNIFIRTVKGQFDDVSTSDSAKNKDDSEETVLFSAGETNQNILTTDGPGNLSDSDGNGSTGGNWSWEKEQRRALANAQKKAFKAEQEEERLKIEKEKIKKGLMNWMKRKRNNK